MMLLISIQSGISKSAQNKFFCNMNAGFQNCAGLRHRLTKGPRPNLQMSKSSSVMFSHTVLFRRSFWLDNDTTTKVPSETRVASGIAAEIERVWCTVQQLKEKPLSLLVCLD